jgi:hypothetical protein
MQGTCVGDRFDTDIDKVAFFAYDGRFRKRYRLRQRSAESVAEMLEQDMDRQDGQDRTQEITYCISSCASCLPMFPFLSLRSRDDGLSYVQPYSTTRGEALRLTARTLLLLPAVLNRRVCLAGVGG